MAKGGDKDDNDEEMEEADDKEEEQPKSSSKKSKKDKKQKKSIDPGDAADADAATTTKQSSSSSISQGKTYEERCKAVNVMSHPLASKKSTKKCYKLVKQASSQKHVRRGVKEVVKGLRKGDTGLAVLAGDIYPLDVMSHLPILLEDYNVPYLFVPSKQDLGAAASTKRPTSCVLIKSPKSFNTNKKGGGSSKDGEFDGQELYETLVKEAKEYNPTAI